MSDRLRSFTVLAFNNCLVNILFTKVSIVYICRHTDGVWYYCELYRLLASNRVTCSAWRMGYLCRFHQQLKYWLLSKYTQLTYICIPSVYNVQLRRTVHNRDIDWSTHKITTTAHDKGSLTVPENTGGQCVQHRTQVDNVSDTGHR